MDIDIDWDEIDSLPEHIVGQLTLSDQGDPPSIAEYYVSQYDYPIEGDYPQSSQGSDNSPQEKNENQTKKRRETIKNSELRRRNRFKAQIEALKELLYEENQPAVKKLTREDILDKAIKELAQMKKKTRKERPKKAPELAVVNPQDDMLLSFASEDLEYAFRFMLFKERAQCSYDGTRNIDALFRTSRMLSDIAERLQKAEYIFIATVFEESTYGFGIFNPKELHRLTVKAQNVWDVIKKEHKTLPLDGHEIIIVLRDAYLCNIAKGDFAAAEKAQEMTATYLDQCQNSPVTRYLFALNLPYEKYFMGDSISVEEAYKFYQEASNLNEPHCSKVVLPSAHLFLGLALAQEGKFNEGIEQVKYAISHLVKTLGDAAEIAFMFVLIGILLKFGQYDDGLREVESVMKKCSVSKFEGCPGLPELLRLKAELLLGKLTQDHKCFGFLPFDGQARISQIQQILSASNSLCVQRENKLSQLLILETLAKLALQFGDAQMKKEASGMIMDTLKSVVFTESFAKRPLFQRLTGLITELNK